jgi:hypothetical protein
VRTFATVIEYVIVSPTIAGDSLATIAIAVGGSPGLVVVVVGAVAVVVGGVSPA